MNEFKWLDLFKTKIFKVLFEFTKPDFNIYYLSLVNSNKTLDIFVLNKSSHLNSFNRFLYFFKFKINFILINKRMLNKIKFKFNNKFK